MPDWLALVSERLPRLLVDARREAEIVEELAQQLEDTCEEALAAGLSERDALERSLSQFPDWKALHREIRRAEEGDFIVNHRLRVYWIPWLAALAAASAWLVVTFRTMFIWRIMGGLSAPSFANEFPGLEFLAIFAPLSLVGAVGAYVAWRLGATKWQRLLAGMFPAFVLPLCYVVYWYTDSPFRIFGARFVFRFLQGALSPFLLFILLGSLPFLFPADVVQNSHANTENRRV